MLAYINLTDACNMNCTYCYQKGKINLGNMTVHELERAIKNAWDSQGDDAWCNSTGGRNPLKGIILFGGEPTVNLTEEHIALIVEMKRVNYFEKVYICTNMSNILPIQMLVNALGSDKDIVLQASIDNPKEDKNERGYSENELKKLKTLRSLYPNMRIIGQIVVTTKNVDDLKEIYDIHMRYIDKLYLSIDRYIERLDLNALNAMLVKFYIENRMYPSDLFETSNSNNKECAMNGGTKVFVDRSGKLSGCYELYSKNERYEYIDDVINREDVDRCKECNPVNKFCRVCVCNNIHRDKGLLCKIYKHINNLEILLKEG